MATKLPDDVRDYLRKIGRKGGEIGGKRSKITMTDEARTERAKKAVAARKKNPVRAKPPIGE